MIKYKKEEVESTIGKCGRGFPIEPELNISIFTQIFDKN